MTSKKDNQSKFYEAGFEKENKSAASVSEPDKGLKNVNSLLESVGLSPIDNEADNAKTMRVPDSGKTKHFNLKKEKDSSGAEKIGRTRKLSLGGHEGEKKSRRGFRQ